jgi:hypothetical protein
LRRPRTKVGRVRATFTSKNTRTLMNRIIRSGLASTVLATVFMMNSRAEDPVAAWNQISENAVKTAGHPPPVAALDFAIVHLAIYDAVESIDRRYAPGLTPWVAGVRPFTIKSNSQFRLDPPPSLTSKEWGRRVPAAAKPTAIKRSTRGSLRFPIVCRLWCADFDLGVQG